MIPSCTAKWFNSVTDVVVVVVDSSAVWDHLEVCDIYNATRVVLVSSALLQRNEFESFAKHFRTKVSKGAIKKLGCHEDGLLSVIELTQVSYGDSFFSDGIIVTEC
jgi:hypothetical protein